MRKDTNKDLDLLCKEGLEDAAVKAPRGAWKAVSARLDSAAPAAAAAPRRSWLLWGAPAFAFAMAALAAVLFVGNTEKTIIQSGEELITVAPQPSGPVAQVEESSVAVPSRESRAGFVPKEIQAPDQIAVLPENYAEEIVEAPVAESEKPAVSEPEAEGEVVVDEAAKEEANELARPKLFIFNLLLTVAVIAMLIWDVFPSYVPFMIGLAVAVFVNYGFKSSIHKKLVNLHAGPALMMCSTLMGAAVLMGILVKTVEGADGAEIPSVITCMSNIIANYLPAFLGRHLPLVIGILSVPLALAFDTDSYFYGMLPVMIGIGAAFGINALPIAVAMVVCRNCATFISPMVPATLLGVGLAEVDIKDHIKSSFLWVWGFSILCMIFAIIIGILPF